jgi:hypothetical protein
VLEQFFGRFKLPACRAEGHLLVFLLASLGSVERCRITSWVAFANLGNDEDMIAKDITVAVY